MSAYELVLASSCDECSRLEDYLSVMAEREGYSRTFLAELQLVAKEAFVNAVRHGNRGRKMAVVTLRFEMRVEKGARELLMEISDSGRGFALHALGDPTHKSRVHRPSGRGVFFMRTFADIIGQECGAAGCTLRLLMRPF